MVLPVVLLVPVAASLCLYLCFRRLAGRKAYWLIAAAVAALTAAVRIGLVGVGAYILEHHSGWLQLPAYAMALSGLPEAALMPRPVDSSVQTLARLSALLAGGSAVWVFAIAYLAAHHRDRT